MNTFSIPTKVQIGNVSSLLADVTDQRIWMVCDGFLADSDNLKTICASLSRTNQVKLFTKVKPEPTAADVAVGFSELQAFKPDTVIAYGGGSAIDLAKAITYFAKRFGFEKLGLIAIPTTSGTGSEVTSASVISIPEKHQKIPLFDHVLLPDRAILDAQQTFTVPPEVTVFTGLDVLTHAIEAIVATKSSDFSDALAEKAACLVFRYLAIAMKEPNNEVARSGLLNASCLAGMSFNHAGLGLTHAIAHQIGATMHVPHGQANALLLIPVIRFNRQCYKANACYAKLTRILGFATATDNDDQCVNQLIKAIEKLYQQLGFEPSSTLDKTQKKIYLNQMSEAALKDATLLTNPVQPTKSCIKAILESI